MTLQDEKFDKSMFDKLMKGIYSTFLIWKFHEVFGKVVTSNKILRESIQSGHRQFVEVKLSV